MSKKQEQIKFHRDHEKTCARLGAKYVKDKNWRAAAVCFMGAEHHKAVLKALTS